MDRTFSFTQLITSSLKCFIFIILLLPTTAFADVDPKYLACVTKSCGDGQNISFPFYIRNQQEHFCGHPGFQLSCNEKGNPVLNLSSNLYIIKQIFYNNQSLRISDAAAFSETNQKGVCSFPRLKNVSLPSDRFLLASDQTAELILLYNCNSSLPEKLLQYKADKCSRDDENGTVLALFEDNSDLGSVSEECTDKVAAPVEKREEEIEIVEMVKRGFLLQWIASNCSVCQASGGKCGFDESIYQFQCYCPDRPHFKWCLPIPVAGNGKQNLKIGIGVGVGGLVLLFAVLSIYIIRFWKRQKYAARNLQSPNTSSLASSKSDLETGTVYFGVPIFSYCDLAEATKNFNHEKELGDGGFGTVYHGKLRDGREVAVKRLYEHNYRRVEQFMNEIEILTRLRHKNLVSLYGCTSRHSQGLLLVYEFVPNGTVADHLHGGQAKSGLLSWPVRMNVAVETASALAYLHASDIIHRDVKTNNILLDNNFTVKVADFGLSRLFPTDVTHISTAPQGTPGYVDPEYYQCYQLTDRSDVYSFGVVLIELISSMPAVDITRHRHEINLANLAVNRIQKCEFDELIDPFLGYDSDKEVKRMTTSVAKLAFLCLQQNKEMRPSMDVVLEELERIQNGEPKYDNHKEKQDEVKNLKSKQPPSPPHCDDASLLKNIRLPSSPISVTEKWVSDNCTPYVSS